MLPFPGFLLAGEGSSLNLPQVLAREITIIIIPHTKEKKRVMQLNNFILEKKN